MMAVSASLTHGSREINTRLFPDDLREEPKHALPPIEGYRKYALLPLSDAVSSLQRVIHMLPHYVRIALEHTTDQETAAIYLYTLEWRQRDHSLHVILNRTLRNVDRTKLIPWLSYLKLFLTALSKLPPVKGNVYRGVKGDLTKDYKIGKRYIWWAFSSCTATISQTFESISRSRTLFNIEQANGKSIKKYSSFSLEDEILLLPGFYFEVIDISNPSQGFYIIRIREFEPPEMLLEPAISELKVDVHDLLKQAYERYQHENDIPRLAIVLPDMHSSWNAENIWKNTFRLFFICECADDNVHLSPHPGYVLRHPEQFFAIHAQYLRLMHNIANHSPSLKQQHLDKIDSILDSLVGHNANTNLKDYMNDTALGNLYRVVRDSGHVQWVCIKHCPNINSTMNELEKLGINFDRRLGKVQVIGQFPDILELDSRAVTRLCQILTSDFYFYRLSFGCLRISRKDLMRVICAAKAKDLLLAYNVELSGEDKGVTVDLVQEILNKSPAKLGVWLNNVSPDEGRLLAQLLVENGRLTGLNILTTTITNECAQAFGESTLTDFSLLNCEVTDSCARILADAFHTNTTLTKVYVSGDMPDPVVNDIIRGVSKSMSIQEFGISINESMGSDGVNAIANLLKTNQCMKSLDLRSNKLNGGSTMIIAQGLKVNKMLTSFDLSDNMIGDEGAKVIGEALTVNATLIGLDMGNNDLSVDGVEFISNSLKTNQALTHLYVADNDIEDDGVYVLSDSIRNLVSLDISGNNVTDEGVRVILKANTNVINLNLSRNRLGDVGAQYLAQFLKSNNTPLACLSVEKTMISVAGIAEIAKALKVNTTLTSLEISLDDPSDNLVTQIIGSLKANSSIIHLKLIISYSGRNQPSKTITERDIRN
ncbi:unnamed protein product [Didymodactylos carnosus]|uniref:NAD(P)(+)--arginine ADP-ribosyltransferase n=1 Tax=Didymodactylos carnosus TaxID=1234261 RepID=A0A8S2I1J1_9BILA|nr:unnamed protein product [Didymodactylos carnosus]CAF3698135.1 unnamed protein product [Didymodactylos carnosus]